MLNLNKGNKDIKDTLVFDRSYCAELCIHECNAHLTHFH